MSARNTKEDWNEPELKRHLGPVQAPEELWNRVHGAHGVTQVVEVRPGWRMSWQWAAAAVAAVAIIAGVTVWQNRDISGE